MTQAEIIQKLSLELMALTGNVDHSITIRRYLNMAYTAGTEHQNKNDDQIVVTDHWGRVLDHFRNVNEAAIELGIEEEHINNVLNGLTNSAGGFKFMRLKEKDLITEKNESQD